MLKFIKEYKLIVAVAGIMLVVAAVWRFMPGNQIGGNSGRGVDGPQDEPRKEQGVNTSDTKTKTEENGPGGRIRPNYRERPRVATNSTVRLPPENKPQDIKIVLVTQGKGEDANWGVKGLCNFVLTYDIECRAEILEKNETEGGEIKVVEQRTYTKCRQGLEVSECDVQLDIFATLPLEQAVSTALVISRAMTATGIGAASAGTVAGAATALYMTAQAVDGKSIRGVLSDFGVNVPEKMEAQVNKFVASKLENANVFRVEKLEGKSYKLTYYQSKETSSPMRISWTYADGSEVPSNSEEMDVLRRVNAFICSDVVPENVRDCQPGATWKVDASQFDFMLDPYVEGTYSGEVELVRRENDQEGDWRLAVEDASLAVVDEQKKTRTTGEVRVRYGEAKVDAVNSNLRAFNASGSCRFTEMKEHHLLCKSRIGGWCDFTVTLLSETK